MKLRNKKTGEIVDLSEGFIKDTYNGEFIQIKPVAISNKEGYLYDSLAELNKDWEDVRTPLITTNRVRELLKNWADYNDIDEVDVSKDAETGCISFSCAYAYIDFYAHEPFVREGEHYTIAELCEGA